MMGEGCVSIGWYSSRVAQPDSNTINTKYFIPLFDLGFGRRTFAQPFDSYEHKLSNPRLKNTRTRCPLSTCELSRQHLLLPTPERKTLLLSN